MLITTTPRIIRTEDIDTSDVTGEQIGQCHKCFSKEDGEYYMVANSRGLRDRNGQIVEYKVTYDIHEGFACTCKSGNFNFANCRHFGVCQHVRWSVACEREIRQAMHDLAVAQIHEQEALMRIATMLRPQVKAVYGTCGHIARSEDHTCGAWRCTQMYE